MFDKAYLVFTTNWTYRHNTEHVPIVATLDTKALLSKVAQSIYIQQYSM